MRFMAYKYKCSKCGKRIVYSKLKGDFPTKVFCEECFNPNYRMKRIEPVKGIGKVKGGW
jgi:predicted nucleic acid-binding Zn ribbon protein